MLDYLNELREGCLEAYTGIIQGLKGDGTAPAPDLTIVQPHVTYIVQFITVVARDSEHSDASVAASAGLIGDLCSAFGGGKIVHSAPLNRTRHKTKRRQTKIIKTQQCSFHRK